MNGYWVFYEGDWYRILKSKLMFGVRGVPYIQAATRHEKSSRLVFMTIRGDEPLFSTSDKQDHIDQSRQAASVPV